MAFTYDLATTVGQVRLLIPDRVDSGHVFEDAEITAFLMLEGNNARLGAALALETIASDQTMVLKVMRLLDLQTDGARVADALLKRAAELRRQAGIEDATGAFGYAEWVLNSFSERERLRNQALRGVA